jgi:HSP20 family protein
MATSEKHPAGRLGDLMSWIEDTGLVRMSERGGFPVVRLEDYIEGQTYVLRAEIPGVDPDKDIEVEIDDRMLTVSGHKREETKDKNHQEFRYGEFSRSVTIPRSARVEEISASYVDGVLEVRMPLTEDGEKLGAKRIPVQRSGRPAVESSE